MSKQHTFHRLTVACLFALLFVSIGWAAPVMYATYAPEEQFIEVNNFEPNDAAVGQESHYICWNRTVHRPASADITMEMYLIQDDGSRIEVDSKQIENYFEQDPSVKGIRSGLPADLRPGEYRYVAVAQMQAANGRVVRQFSWESEKFNITKSQPEPQTC